jgi:arylsulfatase A-like enzyme
MEGTNVPNAVADATGGGTGRHASASPNILFIIVDQLRFPSVFPDGITDPAVFLAKYMPNLAKLWESGVKFGNHFTAGNACTPARGTLITGLYSQQSWLCATILSTPQITHPAVLLMPQLKAAYPTYGRLLRQAGYVTPYIGKWHVSIVTEKGPKLEPYGFDYLTSPDPTGSNLQGTYGDAVNGYHNDEYIAQQATAWLARNGAQDTPWCLTVSLVNPHDKEFFWAGTEFQTYNDLFPQTGEFAPYTYYSQRGLSNPPYVPWHENKLKSPPSLDFPEVPPNWESTQQISDNRKPSTQIFGRAFSSAVWGGIGEDASQTAFSVMPYPSVAPYPPLAPSGSPPKQTAIGTAPYVYWKRNLDSYTQIMGVIDQRLGEVLDAFHELPDAVRNNTVIVFTADHGEYAGAHGYVSGKVTSCYDEAWHVPLIVHDSSGRFVSDIEVVRTGLTSSVDVLPMLVSLGHGGSRSWMVGDLALIYGGRHDLNAMLASRSAEGRPYVLWATDEVAPAYYNFNNSPTHIIGLRTEGRKLGTYADWTAGTANIQMGSAQTEFYDYATEGGILELDNRPDAPLVTPLLNLLVDGLVPNELRAALPGPLGPVQNLAKTQYLIYDALVANMKQSSDVSAGEIASVFGYGLMF